MLVSKGKFVISGELIFVKKDQHAWTIAKLGFKGQWRQKMYNQIF